MLCTDSGKDWREEGHCRFLALATSEKLTTHESLTQAYSTSKEISKIARDRGQEKIPIAFRTGGRPLPRNDQDRVLWTLTEHGGSMAKSDLARRLQTRQTELDVVLQELECAGKVKLTEIKGKLVVGLRDSQ